MCSDACTDTEPPPSKSLSSTLLPRSIIAATLNVAWPIAVLRSFSEKNLTSTFESSTQPSQSRTKIWDEKASDRSIVWTSSSFSDSPLLRGLNPTKSQQEEIRSFPFNLKIESESLPSSKEKEVMLMHCLIQRPLRSAQVYGRGKTELHKLRPSFGGPLRRHRDGLSYFETKSSKLIEDFCFDFRLRSVLDTLVSTAVSKCLSRVGLRSLHV
mmetsp:Transcript_46428/g.140601  ORF Transcript_46428/g.140601 Transcript_46428/m.140601 type:complete len:212 (-) Transcript_46428:156-791(-)